MTRTTAPRRLAVEDVGTGPAVVFVHGSWSDRHAWDAVVPSFAAGYRTITYDRSGHSDSPPPDGPATMAGHVAELLDLIERRDAAPAHLVGNSSGGTVVLRAAVERPDLVASVSAHEPHLTSIVRDDPELRDHLAHVDATSAAVAADVERGDHRGAAQRFVDGLLAEGLWQQLPAAVQDLMTANAPTFLAESRDPDVDGIDLQRFARLPVPVQLTGGTEGVPELLACVERLAAALPSATKVMMDGVGHVPHRTHPEAYAELVREFVEAAAISSSPRSRGSGRGR